MPGSKPITDVIKQRISCRTYQETPIEQHDQQRLRDFLASNINGPFGTRARFALIAATQEDRLSLKGLGTYGFIRGATGFIVGAVEPGPKGLEDYGYLMERAVLFATEMGLGTCWLGGTFTKSRFAEKISLAADESVPAVTAIGYAASRGLPENIIRRAAAADGRLPWEELFFDDKFGNPITPQGSGDYSVLLDMVRRAPSASNKQPWRIVRHANAWHFWLQRSAGYGKGSMLYKLLRLVDLQRVDMGIAMCHFELAARELRLQGAWVVDQPGIEKPNKNTEYVVSWTLPKSSAGSA